MCIPDEELKLTAFGRKRALCPADLLQHLSCFRRFVHLSESYGHKKQGVRKKKLKKKKDGLGRW